MGKFKFCESIKTVLWTERVYEIEAETEEEAVRMIVDNDETLTRLCDDCPEQVEFVSEYDLSGYGCAEDYQCIITKENGDEVLKLEG